MEIGQEYVGFVVVFWTYFRSMPHAAGYHDLPSKTVIDRLVSSYSPTQ